MRHAQATSKALFESDLNEVKSSDIIAALKGDPRLHFLSESDLFPDTIVAKLAAQVNLVASNCKPTCSSVAVSVGCLNPSLAAGKQLVNAGGLYMNNKRVKQIRQILTREDLLDGRMVILRAGSQKRAVVVMKPQE